jgi:hypothetical protein
MVYHSLQYDREKATVTIRIKLSQRKLALGKHRDNRFKCDSMKHQCTYPGGLMYWEPQTCPAAAIYRGTMFSDGSVFRTPTKREVNDAARFYPRSGQKGCDSLDKVFTGTDLPRRCRSLCKDKPQASKVEVFCTEVRKTLELDIYKRLVTRLVLDKGFDLKQLNTFKKFCYILCYRTDSVDLRTNHALKAVSAVLLTNGKTSTLYSCNTSSSIFTLHHTTNPNIFIADHNAALPFRPQYATTLGSHKLNKIVARTNTAL